MLLSVSGLENLIHRLHKISDHFSPKVLSHDQLDRHFSIFFSDFSLIGIHFHMSICNNAYTWRHCASLIRTLSQGSRQSAL